MWFAGSRLWLAPLLSLLCAFPSTSAIHESDVGVVDWYRQLIGVPLTGSSSTAPTFHYVNGTSLVLTVTGNNVLAALHADNGTVAWRYIYDPEDRISGFYRHDNVIATLSGSDGSTLRTFDAISGTLIIERRLQAPELGYLSEPHDLGKHVLFSPDSEGIFVLSGGHTVSHVHGVTGELEWTWSSPDQTSLTMYSKLVATPDAIYVIGISKSFASFTLHATSLHPSTGAVLSTKPIPSSIREPLNELLVLAPFALSNRQTQQPHIVWLEQNLLKSIPLTPKLDNNAKSMKDAYSKILDVNSCDHGHFVAIKMDGTSKVMRVWDGLMDVLDFEGSAANEDIAEPLYGGGLGGDGRVHISRVFWSHSLQKLKTDIISSHPTEGVKAVTPGLAIPFDTQNHGIIGHFAIDATYPTRFMFTTSAGALQLWHQGDLQWTREEGLANIVAAEFVELPEAEATGGVGDDSFIGRISRQVRDAQNFPQYLINFTKRFATGSYASASSPATSTPRSAPLTLTRDPFGFRQVIVAATAPGKVYGLDSADGSVLWSRVLGLGWAGETGVGGTIHVAKIFVVGDLADGGHQGEKARGPQVVLVAQRRAENTLVDTVIFHIDALTGEDASGVQRNDNDRALQGKDIISGPMVEAYLLDHDDVKVVLLLDEHLQVYLYPSTPSTISLFTRVASSLYFPLRTPKQIIGHKPVLRPGSSDLYVAYPTWTLSLPEGESIKTMVKPHKGQVASIGKVLANRTTLYKYLNPRLFVLMTEPSARMNAQSSAIPGTTKHGDCGVYVVDAAKGTVIYRATVPGVAGPSGVGGVCDVKVSLAENWLVYHYYDDDFSGEGQTKGWRMVSVELYEGKGIDDKTMSSDMSSYSSKSMDVMAIEKAYVFPHAITAMAPTSTKFGITNKDLIVTTKNHQVQSVQRRLLNPRRPNRKVTAEEQEEFLVPYEPVLAYDPRRVLSHNYEVANTQRVVTAPALLESTSLVFTYGLDLFLTRVAPSNTFDVLSENFNKVQLVLTISGLALAIMITKPMVRRKKLREKWYQ